MKKCKNCEVREVPKGRLGDFCSDSCEIMYGRRTQKRLDMFMEVKGNEKS